MALDDCYETGKLAEKDFKMSYDGKQIPATKKNVTWIFNNIPDCNNVIKFNGEIIGFSFIIPCSKKIMNLFIKNKINENELFELVKKSVGYENFETIYICSIFIKPKYRGQNLASLGLISSIKKITKKRKLKPSLFCQPYTDGGRIVSEKTAKKSGLKLITKI